MDEKVTYIKKKDRGTVIRVAGNIAAHLSLLVDSEEELDGLAEDSVWLATKIIANVDSKLVE